MFLDSLQDRMEKVAITHYLGHVSPVFDVARNLLTVSVRDGQEQEREEAILAASDPFLRAQKVRALGIDVVVCGAISKPFVTALSVEALR